jgi:broad specificity phosphatase PhoE
MALKRLVFIRPGETDWNLNGRWQGWLAIPLNKLGEQQVHRLGSFIRNIGMGALYSSDNKRAAQTAEILSQYLGYPPVFDERLRERHIGHWQGLILPEVRSWYADEYSQMLADLDGYRIPGGGESLNDVRQRALPALREIMQKGEAMEGNASIGIVSHTTAIRLMLLELMPDGDVRNLNFSNSSVTTVTRNDDGSWRLTTADDTGHLEGLTTRHMVEVEYEK